MKDLNKLNRIKRQIVFENVIAVGVEHENGDMEYQTTLEKGGVVRFYVPKKDTFIKCEKLKTQEFAINIIRYIVE